MLPVPTMAPLKLFKIRRHNNGQLYAIATGSLVECRKKGCTTLKMKFRELKAIFLEDGTILEDEDYFQHLAKDTILIFSTEKKYTSYADLITSMLPQLRMDKRTADELITKTASIVNKCDKKMLISLARHLKGNCEAETRSDDEQWFESMEPCWKTKSQVMEASAKNRIRSYYYEAKKLLSELPASKSSSAKELLAQWLDELKANEWYLHYFSRKRLRSGTFCDAEGWFSCEGDYKAVMCSKGHSINPYTSAEERALFSTWNLDHRVEKARTVLPRMVELMGKSNVNWYYFYELLFTRKNLKLVDIACHIKREHTEAQLDEREVCRK